MAARDIMPFSSQSGGHNTVSYAKIDATEDYDEGDVVFISSGDVTEAADEPAVETVGVAAAASLSVASIKTAAGTLAAANTAGEVVPFYEYNLDNEFVTRNLEEADTAGPFGDVPDEDNVGELCSLRVGSGVWGVCTHASSSNRDFKVTRVLDTNGVDVAKSGDTGVYVVFKRAV